MKTPPSSYPDAVTPSLLKLFWRKENTLIACLRPKGKIKSLTASIYKKK